MLPTQEMIDQAKLELASKTFREIQQETALKSAARFLAARSNGSTVEAEDFRHEAIEHGALAGDLDLVRFLLTF